MSPRVRRLRFPLRNRFVVWARWVSRSPLYDPTLMKVRDVIRMIEKEGWRLVRTRGSHRQFRHPDKQGLVTIAGKAGNDLAPGTLASILKQAGLTER